MHCRGRGHVLLLLLVFLLPYESQAARPQQGGEDEMVYEKQRYDGWYNNRAHPEWGSRDSRLVRKAPAAYDDGVYMMSGQNRPSPRQLSEVFLKGTDGVGSVKNRTGLLAFFGQVVTSEIIMASESPSCPLELTKIQISNCDEMYDKECSGVTTMPFYRSMYDRSTGQSPNMPREQKNRVSSWIDGSFIYSTIEPWANIMRTFSKGELKLTSSGYPPLNTEGVPLHNFPVPSMMKTADPARMYVLGDPRTNQNPAMLSFGILFYRWHNVLAKRVRKKHPSWTDEDIFQAARRLNIASLQNIIVYEYLPAFLGVELAPYTGYKADVHPGISHVFQSAAFRFGHSLIPPGIYRRDGQCNFINTSDSSPALRLCSSWWDAQEEVFGTKLEDILRGLTSQIAEKEDSSLCADIRNKLFGPLDFSRRDLAALNIMRGRDSGLPDYNTVRTYFGLPRVYNWSEINPVLFREHPDLFRQLEEVYGVSGLSDIDLYVGGMLESHEGPGPLFRNIIIDQFERIRDGDRFWFENRGNGIFSEEEVAAIRNITIWDIIVNATSIGPNEIQRKGFFWNEGDPCQQPKQLSHTDMKPCLIHQKYDYFQGSEMAYIYGILLIVVFPLLTVLFSYFAIKYSNSKRREARASKANQMAKKSCVGKGADKMHLREWLSEDTSRPVKTKFCSESSTLHTYNRKGDLLCSSLFPAGEPVLVHMNMDRTGSYLLLLKATHFQDQVFAFESLGERKRFLYKLEALLAACAASLHVLAVDKETLIQNAETREKRQEKLEQFFREAYVITFGLKKADKKKYQEVCSGVMSLSLSRAEFASALGMKPNDMFVQKMFKVVDKERNGRISFRNFLDTVVLFSQGTCEDKIRIIYDMCDEDSRGYVNKKSFKDMLASLIDIAKTEKIQSSDVSELINSMLSSAGLKNKTSLSYDDFKVLMSRFKGDLLSVGLDCKGAQKNFLDTRTTMTCVPKGEEGEEEDEEGEGLATACKSSIKQRWEAVLAYLEENRQNIVYLIVFYVITLALFVERFMHYSFMAEHTDLRQIMGVGIAITRGAAAALTFCYSVLLLTVCRNLISKMKEFSLHQYIPLDAHIEFHKICACTAIVFSLMHTAGHLVNFYHVSTQPSHHLECMSKELLMPHGVTPNISYWFFNTMTGITGIVLYCTMTVIFVFAMTAVRKQAYRFFWLTHQLYIILYLLNLVHGMARITQPPKFYAFVLGPAIVFILDKIVSLRRSYMELDILETTLLPSDVTKVKFYRPPNFKFLSGQYVRLSCTAINPEEFHSLTLTSAPHEDFLSVHIKAVGPWTWKLRNYFDRNHGPDTDALEENSSQHSGAGPVPRIRLQGPFGGGNQDWYKFEVAVMIGAGIGVTPYASILNDLVFGTSTNRYSGVACKKVYFLWICPSHRSFEWFIDALRDAEKKDVTRVLEIHIFITQFFHKFDLRTTMLYICENHFQRLFRRSLFTGLRAHNHFGRPDMGAFLKFVQKKHSYVSNVGVFSCGPSHVIKANTAACEEVNKSRKLPYFHHHFERF